MCAEACIMQRSIVPPGVAMFYQFIATLLQQTGHASLLQVLVCKHVVHSASSTHLICLCTLAVVRCTTRCRHLQVCNADTFALTALTMCGSNETICGLQHHH